MQNIGYTHHVHSTQWHLAVCTAQLNRQAKALTRAQIHKGYFRVFEISQTWLHDLSFDDCPNWGLLHSETSCFHVAQVTCHVCAFEAVSEAVYQPE